MTIRFDQRVETSRSPDALWNTLERALQDSNTVSEWPSRLSELRRVGEDELAATYKGLGGSATYRYALGVDPAKRCFRYDAIEGAHPFRGGATVCVEPTARGSDLVWSGAYQAGVRQWPKLAAFKLGFEPLFFRSLRRNLSQPESER